MPIVNQLVQLGMAANDATLVQSVLAGTATSNDLVKEGFSPTMASAIAATPPVADTLVRQGMWKAAADLVVAEYAALNPPAP